MNYVGSVLGWYLAQWKAELYNRDESACAPRPLQRTRLPLYLRTLGGLAIEAGNGSPVPAPGPRRLALLAILAAAGSRGTTREKLLGILWPDKHEEQARHTLSQTLYLLKREVGEACVTGTTLLRLESSVTSDITQFQEAVAAGQLVRAVELYTGPFLDGFYLADAREFEAWVDETRARLETLLRKSLETLARTAVDTNALGDAANWWQRLMSLDPFNPSYAAGRIRALMESGDHVRALAVAREYEARIRHELEDEPDPVIVNLVQQLRTHSDSSSGAANGQGAPATPPLVTDTRLVSSATPEPPAAPVPGPRGRRRWLVAAAVLVVTAGIPALQIAGARRARAASIPLLALGTIESRDSTALALVLRDMLATNLGRLSGIRIVSQTRLLELDRSMDSSLPSQTSETARRAGATEVIEGELRSTGEGLLLTLRRVAIASGEVLQGYQVIAPDVFALTDSATNAISADFGLDPPPGAVASVRTRSSVAYALYEQGLRAFYNGDYHAAAQLLYAALGRDSTFAMAAVYAWRTQVNLSRFEQANRDLPIVQRLASRAPDRERLVIEALIARFGGAPLSEYLPIAERLTERYPDEAEGHLLLGRAFYNAGEWQRSIDAYNRAVAIDSAAGASDNAYCRLCEAIGGILESYLWFDSAAAAERTARRLFVLRPDEAIGWGMLVEPILRQGRRSDAEAASATASRIAGNRTIDYHALHRDLIRSGRLDELESRLTAEVQTAPSESMGELPWLLAFVLRNQGRLREARELATNGVIPGVTRRLESFYEPTTLAIVSLEGGRPREAARLFLTFVKSDRDRNDGPGFVARSVSWHMTLAATALAAAGDTAMVRALADSVERIGQQSSIVRDYRIHHFLLGLLLQRQNRHAEAVDAFRRSLVSMTDGYTRINLELGRSLIAIRQFGEAVAVLQPALRGGVDGANTYVTHTELHETLAHAFYGAGRRDSAAVHYAAVERAWRKSDPEFKARYEVARQRSAPSP